MVTAMASLAGFETPEGPEERERAAVADGFEYLLGRHRPRGMREQGVVDVRARFSPHPGDARGDAGIEASETAHAIDSVEIGKRLHPIGTVDVKLANVAELAAQLRHQTADDVRPPLEHPILDA